MSLPTPPGTSHRDEKENRAPRFSRVSWCETDQYRDITASPPRLLSARASASKPGPSRSILKKTDHLTLPPEEPAKETTPEPEDPLTNLTYLSHQVEQIIALDASLRDLITAYSILAARLRSCVAGNTDADASWPLFQPIRKHREAFVGALVRDVRQVFVDPLEGTSSVLDSPCTPIHREPPSTSSLPSPRDSPRKKKKRGMNEEQVKRARDLCGVCHAAIRLLSAIFTLPPLYNLFEDEELGFLLTQVLAIPLANELPTPNARKTCALAIWLIQTQRLPVEVLEPAKDRIAHALRRGIDGELGKEGKKGSVTDGLKAIHDLSVYQPAIFVPAFAPILGAVMDNLLAPTLQMRNQACHALGGLSLAAASLPPSEAHTMMSTTVASRLTKASDPSATTPTKRKLDSSPSKDPILVRTLRTTLQAVEPKYASQGPVWGFSVIAHLIVLLGPTVFLHGDITRTIVALFSLGMRHQKSSVRGIGCLAWRSMTWAFFRPPHVRITVDAETDGEDDSATEDDVVEERKEHEDALRSSYKVLLSIIEMGTGVCTAGAFLGVEMLEMQVYVALRVLRNMSRKGGQTCKDAMDVAQHLLSGVFAANDDSDAVEWDHHKLLAPDFFSANPGLLTTEWKSLSSVVKAVLDQAPQISDLRTLTLDEITADGMWDEFLGVWRDGLSVLRLTWGQEEVPVEVREIWHNLLKCHAAIYMDAEDHEGMNELALKACEVLINILGDPSLDFTVRRDEFADFPTSPVKPAGTRPKRRKLPEDRWNFAIKLYLVRDLFTIARAVFPQDAFADLSETLLRWLNAHEDTVLDGVRCTDEVREQWSCLCAEAAFACEVSVLQAFWNNALRRAQRPSEWPSNVRKQVWNAFCDKWGARGTSTSLTWEGAVVLLCVPFVEPSYWDIEGEDLDNWDVLLRKAIDAALDHGIDATSLVEQVAGVVATNQSPSTISAVRVAELLLSNIEVAEARQVPTETIEFANDTLNASYPPEPKDKVKCMWLIRALTRVIDMCPQNVCFPVLELLVDGISTWVTDDYQICSEDEYSVDILPLYQTVLVALQTLPAHVEVLEKVAPVLVAPFKVRKDRHTGAVEAFAEFWQYAFAELPEPVSGYPEQVVECLDVVAQARIEEQEEEARVENMTAIDDRPETPVLEDVPIADDPDMDVDSDGCESEDEGSFVIPSPDTLARISASRLRTASPSPELTRPPLPSTPQTSLQERTLWESIPPRPHKSAVKDHGLTSGPSPPKFSADPSPPRAPTTPKRSPAKGSDKENASPARLFETVAERLAARSPLLLDSVLGKRPRNDDGEALEDTATTVSKKCRLDVSPLAPSAFSNVQVHMVEHDEPAAVKESLVQPASVTSATATFDDDNDSSDASPIIASRKRKGVFVEAVEVPELKHVLRIWRRASTPLISSASSSASAPAPQAAAPVEETKPTIRRTRSATRLLGDQADFQRLPNTPKKRKMTRAKELRLEAVRTASPSSPLRFVRDAPLFGSDDSIMIASPHTAADLPPSDDDPHTGQVTPHRLVSPALRRVQQQRMFFNSDPPSDDSDLSISPTHERITHKIARRTGFTPRPTVLGMRSRSPSDASSSGPDSDL